MLSRFFKDIGIYGISGFFSKAVSLFLVPFFTRVLTTSDYGFIDLVAIIATVVGVFFSLEIYQAIARYYSEAMTALIYSNEQYINYANMYKRFCDGHNDNDPDTKPRELDDDRDFYRKYLGYRQSSCV